MRWTHRRVLGDGHFCVLLCGGDLRLTDDEWLAKGMVIDECNSRAPATGGTQPSICACRTRSPRSSRGAKQMADNFNRRTVREPGEGQDEESLAERAERIRLREEERQAEKARLERYGK
jgi:hypothetical protein